MLKTAINNYNIDNFVANAFNNLDFPTAYYNFYQFFRSMEDDKNLRKSFFRVFDAICKNSSLLANYCAAKLINMICRRYFDIKHLDNDAFDEISIIRFIMNNVQSKLRENVVIANFDNIVKDSYYEDIQYFSVFNSWRELIGKYFEDFMKLMGENYNYFISFSKIFPEYTNRVYEYLLSMIINGQFDFSYYVEDFSLINHILEPMADIEKYSSYYFSIIRDNVERILDLTCSYSESNDVASFLIKEFDIPVDSIDKFVNEDTTIFINNILRIFCPRKYDERIFSEIPELIEILKDFLASSNKAYYDFLDNLPLLIDKCGIFLYATLITVIGPIPELTKYESLCYDYFNI